MKRLLVLSLAGCMMLALASCGNTGTQEEADVVSSEAEVNTEEVTEETDATESAAEEVTEEVAASVEEDAEEEAEADAQPAGGTSSALVVYFSRTGEQYGVGEIETGNTAIVADILAEETGADSFELVPVEDYPYTYDALLDVASEEQSANARPAYVGEVPDLSQYEKIYIGAPVWWGDWPMIMYTFFEENADNLAGKTLLPFSTHAGSGLSGFDTKLQAACPDASVTAGLAVRGADAQENPDSVREQVQAWLASVEE